MLIDLGDGVTFAEIDDADSDIVAPYTWRPMRVSGKVYARTTIGNKTVLMHRHLTDAAAGQVVDHKDRNGLNNRRTNMRPTTAAGNAANSIKSSRAGLRSRYKGVSLSQSTGRWHGRITSHGRVYSLGLFLSEKAAAIAYNRAARRLFGEMALLNDMRAA